MLHDQPRDTLDYMVSLQLGSQNQPVTLVVDPESTWMWVKSDQCTDCGPGKGYVTSDSHSFNLPFSTYNYTYS